MLAAPEGGVTIITHGFQANGAFPDWVVTMGQAILDRADGALSDRSVGSLFQHNPATGRWDAAADGVWRNSNAFDEPIVLLYNWADESNDLDDGWLEAAADNLFASLIDDNDDLAGELANRSFFEVASAAGGGGGLLNLHFIGHSRGAVLNSRVVARFDFHFDVAIDHVTSLDPHPASFMNDPGYSSVNPNELSRLITNDNVVFADNYFRQDGTYEPLNFDFNGVAADGAYNIQIPEAVLANGGSALEHSDVHAWYYGTVTAGLGLDYAGFSGAGRDHDGDVAIPAAWYGVGDVPSRDAVGFALSRIGGADRSTRPILGLAVNASEVDLVFNGDFALGNSLFIDELPGWERHGGGGTAGLGGANPYIELNAGGDDFLRRHNRLFFPLHSVAIVYDYWVNDGDEFFPNDALQVLVGEEVVDTISLASATGGFVGNRRASLGFAHTGFVETLTFRILDAGSDGIDSAVRIDNIHLDRAAPAPQPDLNSDGSLDGRDFLAWQRAIHPYDGHGVGSADGDGDGDVDRDDLRLWEEVWGGASLSHNGARPIAESAGVRVVAMAFAVPNPSEWAFGLETSRTKRSRRGGRS